MTLLDARWLPPSELIRGGVASDAQVNHALCRLGFLYLMRYRSEHAVRAVLSDERGWLHRWGHRMDCGTVDGRPAGRRRALRLAEELERVERRVWR